MNNKSLVIDKDTRKLFRLQTSEKYIIKKLNERHFTIFTKDLKFKADLCKLECIILASCNEYDKIDFYKLRNFCVLLERCHFN